VRICRRSDYAAQCVFGIPTDIPEPRDDESGTGRQSRACCSSWRTHPTAASSRCFTSHGALRRTADAIRGQGHVGARWPLLVQGEGQRDQLLRRFRDAGRRFCWERIRSGKALTYRVAPLRVLILAKLPFKVPSEPLTAARLERLTDAGVDGFTHYSCRSRPSS